MLIAHASCPCRLQLLAIRLTWGHVRNEPGRKPISSTVQYSSHHPQCLTVLASITGIKCLLRFNPEAAKAFVLGAN